MPLPNEHNSISCTLFQTITQCPFPFLFYSTTGPKRGDGQVALTTSFPVWRGHRTASRPTSEVTSRPLKRESWIQNRNCLSFSGLGAGVAQCTCSTTGPYRRTTVGSMGRPSPTITEMPQKRTGLFWTKRRPFEPSAWFKWVNGLSIQWARTEWNERDTQMSWQREVSTSVMTHKTNNCAADKKPKRRKGSTLLFWES